MGDGYKTPLVTVPYAWSKPKIDGVIGDEEWAGAESANALQTVRGQLSVRQTRFWMMWDEDNLYMAMRSPLRPGERIVQKIRDRDRDINVVFDDSYEIWLDVGAKSPDGQPVFFQFLCNYAGARYDVMHEPAVGNSRLGWTAGWDPTNRISPGNDWEFEVVIPRKSIHKGEPFADGFSLTCLVARNFKRPWEQNSFEGTGSFAVRESHSRFVLSKTAPAIHVLRVADPQANAFGLELAAFGRKNETLKWSFETDGGPRMSGTLAVPKGRLARGGPGMGLDKPGPGKFRIRVTSADGSKTYLDWCALRAFGQDPKQPVATELDDKGDEVSLSLVSNPVGDYVRATGDFINFDARDRIDRCDFTVHDAGGKQIAKESFRLDELSYVRGVIRTGDVPFGQYVTRMKCIGKDGKVMLERESNFSKKDHTQFPWWNTKAGNIEKVVPPWTPVTFDKRAAKIGVWGREMTVGAAGLPAKITSQGRDLLAGPAVLRAELPDGRIVDAAGSAVKAVFQKDHRFVGQVAAKLANLDVKTQVTAEFDGMYKVEMSLVPRGKVNVKSLKVILPLAEAAAEYVHACGEGIRYGFYYGFLPRGKRGRIWDCLTVDSQPMVVGSFIPYVWVGGTGGGVCFFADSDEGWVPNDKVPAIEIRRDGKSADLVLNLIGSPATIDKPRKIVFALQASPVKPLHKGWRMDSWWCGDTFRNYVYPDGKGSLIWQSLPFTTDTEACRKMVEAQHRAVNGYIFGINKYRANAVPYYEYNTMGAVPEKAYFGEEWQASSGPLYYGKTLTDFIMYNMDKWCRETGIDGWYLDNVRPVYCDNIEAGRGYRLGDGRVQPTYTMFGMREFFLRLRAVFVDNGRAPKIVNHMTNNMIIPWNGAVDIAYDGEHHVIYPEMGKDFMDFWSLERLRVDFAGQWGTAVNFMHEYQGTWDPASHKKAMRAYTGVVALHDALPSGNSNGGNQELWIGRDRFGIEADDVEFIPYWQKDAGLTCATKDVYVGCWKRPGKVLLIVVNKGEKCDAAVKVDSAKLGLPAGSECKAWDAETEAKLGIAADGMLRVPVGRHDYRQVIVEVAK